LLTRLTTMSDKYFQVKSAKIVGSVAKVSAGKGWGTARAQWSRATACGKVQHPGWLVCSNAACRLCRPEEAALLSIEMHIARI
jgi:hypothetical protein